MYCMCALYVDLLIVACVPVLAGTMNTYVNWASSLLFTMVLISLQVHKIIQSKALFLCGIMFSLGDLLQLTAIALGAATPSSLWQLPSSPFSPYKGVTSLSHTSAPCVCLLQVNVFCAHWMWTQTSVYWHYSCARSWCTGGRTPADKEEANHSKLTWGVWVHVT